MPAIEWQESFNGLGTAISVHQTPDGGYLVGGSQWLLKTDSVGTEEWRRNFDDGHARSVEPTADGGCVVCGWTDSASRETDAWVMKLDPSGNEEWQSSLGRGDAWSVQQTTDGGYVLGISTSCSFDEQGSVERCDARLVKIDYSGDLQWQRTFSSTDKGSGLGLSVRQTADGGYAIFATWGITDSRLLKVDAAGDEEWTQTYRNMRSSSPVVQTPDPDGGYVFLTREVIPSTGELVGRNWLIKTDPTGEMERLKLFNNEYGWSVQSTSDQGYVVLAFKKEVGSLLIKTDSRVMEEWVREFRTDDGESAQAVQQTLDGGYIVAATKCPDASHSNPDDCRTWLVKIAGPAPD